MSHSTHRIEYVLVYDSIQDKARWMTKAQGTLLQNSRPGIEFVIEGDAGYEAIAQLAGMKPEVYVRDEVFDAKRSTSAEKP